MSERQAKRVIDIEKYKNTNKPIEPQIWWTTHNMDSLRLELNKYLELTGYAYNYSHSLASYNDLCECLKHITNKQTELNIVLTEPVEQPVKCCCKEIETLKDELEALKTWKELINADTRIQKLEKDVVFNLKKLQEMINSIIENYNN
jgi:hypothetical protein